VRSMEGKLTEANAHAHDLETPIAGEEAGSRIRTRTARDRRYPHQQPSQATPFTETVVAQLIARRS